MFNPAIPHCHHSAHADTYTQLPASSPQLYSHTGGIIGVSIGWCQDRNFSKPTPACPSSPQEAAAIREPPATSGIPSEPQIGRKRRCSSSRDQLHVQGLAGLKALQGQGRPRLLRRPRQAPEGGLLSGKETWGFDAAALISLTATE